MIEDAPRALAVEPSSQKAAELEALEEAYRALESPRRDGGTVDLIVCRRGGGEHHCPDRVELTIEDGLVGDSWSIADDPDRLSQVTLMMTPVVRAVAAGKPLHLPGDNFVVDLELADDVLPIGSQVKLGSAIVEITPEPHTGCATFSERLGSSALRWINHKSNRLRRLRGVNCRVVEPGRVALGDQVTVIRRGLAPSS